MVRMGDRGIIGLFVTLIPTIFAASHMKVKYKPEIFTNFGFHLPGNFTCPVNDAKRCQVNFVFRAVEDSGNSTTKIVRGLPLDKSGLIEFQQLLDEDLHADSLWVKTPQTLTGNASIIIFQVDVYVSDVLLRNGDVQDVQFRIMDSFAHSFLHDLPESAENCQPQKHTLKGQLIQTNLTLMLGIYCDKNWWGEKCNMTCKIDTDRGYLKCNSTHTDTFWCQQIQSECGFQAINCSYCAPEQIPCEPSEVMNIVLDKAGAHYIILLSMAGIAVIELMIIMLLLLLCYRKQPKKSRPVAMEIRSYEAEPYRKIPPVEGQLKMIPPSKHQQENIYQTSLTPAETKKMYRISAQPSSLSLKGRREVQV